MDKSLEAKALMAESERLRKKAELLEIEVAKELKEKSKVDYYTLKNYYNTLLKENEEIEKPFLKDIYKLKRQMALAVKENETKIHEVENLLLTNCPHVETKKLVSSTDGDYLNTGSHITVWVCENCGKELDRKEISTGYA